MRRSGLLRLVVTLVAVFATAAPAASAATPLKLHARPAAGGVRVDVRAPGTPRRVSLFLDGRRVRTDARAPFRFARIDTHRLRRGTHRVRAVALYKSSTAIGWGNLRIESGRKVVWLPAGWNAGFEGASFADWSWWKRPEFDRNEFGVVGTGTDGVAAHTGSKLAKFVTTRAQVDGGLQHAKLYKEWAVRSPETSWKDDAGQTLQKLPGSGQDASGTYSAWYYLPADVRWTKDWSNVMQFKLVFPTGNGAVASEAHWYVNLMAADSWGGGPARADGSTPKGTDPVFVASNWTMKRVDGSDPDWHSRMVSPPVGRWFKLSATVKQGQSIEFAIDDKPFFRGSTADWPVGIGSTPTHQANDVSGWIFGAGLYGGPGRLYVDDAAFAPAA